MKKELRSFSHIALMVLVGTSAAPSLAQQRQPGADRVSVERKMLGLDGGPASTGPDRSAFERDIVMAGPQGPGVGDFAFVGREMSFGGKIVKGAPYSAQAVTESVQTLPDGNRIVNKWAAAVYRDSEGRTRREQTLKAIGPFASGSEQAMTVFISDPVAGASYTLDAQAQTARKMKAMRFEVSSPKVGELKVLERSSSPDERYKIGSDAATELKKSMEASAAMGVMTSRNRVGHTESIGKQNIGGVEAEGTRTTVTIPAGEIGNERPIEIVSERWYSPELQVIVMTRHTDPRFGENSYQLTNINRSEPAHELFEVPPGYTVKEVSGALYSGALYAAGSGTGEGVGTGVGGGINGGVLNGKATTLPMPEYPDIARQAKASGTVTVQVMIDEGGNVISATAVTGHPLLRAAAVKAAREARFLPTRLSGQPVKTNGVIVYNFIAQ